MAGGRLCKIVHQYIFACQQSFASLHSSILLWHELGIPSNYYPTGVFLLRCCHLKIPFMPIHLSWPTQGWFMPATYLKFETLNCFTTLLLQLQMDCAKFDITIEEESWIGENYNFTKFPFSP